MTPLDFVDRMAAVVRQTRNEPAVRDALAYRLMRDALLANGYYGGLALLDAASEQDAGRIEARG